MVSLEQNLATLNQNITSLIFLVNHLVQLTILGILDVAPTNGGTHVATPLGNTSQGTISKPSLTTLEATDKEHKFYGV